MVGFPNSTHCAWYFHQGREVIITVSLQHLLDSLGPDVLRPVWAPDGATGNVGPAELLDLADPRPAAPGATLLGLGLRAGPGLDAELARCAARGAAAVVLKTHGADLAGVDFAGLTILAAGDELDWVRLRDLIERVRTAAGPRPPALGGGDLFGLANAVATLAGGAVAIMNTERTIVAYSTIEGQPIDETRRQGILGRAVPEAAMEFHRQAWRSDGPVRIERPGDLPRLAVAVRVGGDLLGSLWIAQPEFAEPSTATKAALVEAAGICAVHLLRLREHTRREGHQRNRAFQDALSGSSTVDTADLALPGRLVALSGPESTVEHGVDALAMVDVLELDAGGFGLTVATATVGRIAFALVSGHGSTPHRFAAYVEHIRARVRSAPHGVVSAQLPDVTSLRSAVADIRTAFEHAEDVLRPDAVLELDGLRTAIAARRVIAQVAGRAELRSGLADRILRHDRENDTAFGPSLLAYLSCFGDITAAAERLHVHHNTLRYRLKQYEGLFGVRLDRAEDKLVLWLELTALSPH